MPLYSYLEFSYDQVGWRNIFHLVKASVKGSKLLDVYDRNNCFCVSIEALRSDENRQDWIQEAQGLELSDGFVAIATKAAELGARKICIRSDSELDPELPILTQGRSDDDSDVSANACPHRYLIADSWSHIFLDRYGEEDVRWIADWSRMKIIKIQVYDHDSEVWEEADDMEFYDVVESVEQNGCLADPEEFGLLYADELPDWAAH
jgi:hypothetical protein